MSQEGQNMAVLKVRFSKDTRDILDDLAKRNHMSRADLIRRCVAGNLAEYFGQIRILDPEQEAAIRAEIRKLFDAVSRTNDELNRIGVNYNQEVKLMNQKGEHLGDKMAFPGSAIDTVMVRFESAAKEAGEALCRLLS